MIHFMTQQTPSLSGYAAGELRAYLGRLGISVREASKRVGKEYAWLSRRLNGTISPSLDDLELICRGLGIPVGDIVREPAA